MKTKIHRLSRKEADLVRDSIALYWSGRNERESLFSVLGQQALYVETVQIRQLALESCA